MEDFWQRWGRMRSVNSPFPWIQLGNTCHRNPEKDQNTENNSTTKCIEEAIFLPEIGWGVKHCRSACLPEVGSYRYRPGQETDYTQRKLHREEKLPKQLASKIRGAKFCELLKPVRLKSCKFRNQWS